MKEHAATFGRGENLIGVTSEPVAPPDSARPDVLILNSGLLHKVGAFRLSVDLGRALAGIGFRAMRFDLSGLGDSRMQVGDAGVDRPVLDTREAMNHLAGRHGTRRFVLMGLCSGADNSHRTAVVDDRVAGVVHLDGFGYKTKGFSARHYGGRVLSPTYWRSTLAARREPPEPTRVGGGGAMANTTARIFPPREQVERELHALMARDVRLLYIFTFGMNHLVNYRDQIRDTFPSVDFGNRLELERYPYAEHTFPQVRSREEVVRRIVDWMRRTFL